ncbi:MAG: helix-turn-helix transcriptional regulator [Saprospiraceae bacterium]|nr:helix-turn-helix transcriptional regulator [Saprospiraceae bacterium]
MANSKNNPIDHHALRLSADTLRALANPLRLRIIAMLLEQPSICVQNIYSELGVEQSIASQHLRILRQARLVYTTRKGKFVYYLLDEERLKKAGAIAGQLAALVGKPKP